MVSGVFMYISCFHGFRASWFICFMGFMFFCLCVMGFIGFQVANKLENPSVPFLFVVFAIITLKTKCGEFVKQNGNTLCQLCLEL